jgi:hypothetical protein
VKLIHAVSNRAQWRPVVNMVMNIFIHKCFSRILFHLFSNTAMQMGKGIRARAKNGYFCYLHILEGKSQHGRSRVRQEDSSEVDRKETEWEAGDWIHLALNKDQWRPIVSP